MSAFGVKVEKREKYFIFLIIYIKIRRIKKIPKLRLLLEGNLVAKYWVKNFEQSFGKI